MPNIKEIPFQNVELCKGFVITGRKVELLSNYFSVFISFIALYLYFHGKFLQDEHSRISRQTNT